MKTLISSFYTIVLALWVGGMSLFTFVITPVIFKAHTRDEAGSIVGHLFPSYFLYNLALSAIALFLFFFVGRQLSKFVYILSILLLISSLIMNLLTVTLIYPKMETLKIEIKSFETADRDLPAQKAFSKLHGLSAILNLLVLMQGIVLIILSISSTRE